MENISGTAARGRFPADPRRSLQPDTSRQVPNTSGPSDSLLHWLTERYRLYAADGEGGLYAGDIHHLPWPLQEIVLDLEANSATAALGQAHPAEPPLTTYTNRLEVPLWVVKPIDTH
ncbi:DUF2071 domain-containing protein [Paenibacillus tengchongensis]|uniref:DUF2071 domain-containing protein n=1 Tax=Paenibacillus tengchongensis TaxID=2608684 RepID=UPI00124E2D29|nr:DUF2071 domain-containing protein [Paenibacillus tengchongensis]